MERKPIRYIVTVNDYEFLEDTHDMHPEILAEDFRSWLIGEVPPDTTIEAINPNFIANPKEKG